MGGRLRSLGTQKCSAPRLTNRHSHAVRGSSLLHVQSNNCDVQSIFLLRLCAYGCQDRTRLPSIKSNKNQCARAFRPMRRLKLHHERPGSFSSPCTTTQRPFRQHPHSGANALSPRWCRSAAISAGEISQCEGFQDLREGRPSQLGETRWCHQLIRRTCRRRRMAGGVSALRRWCRSRR